MNQKNSLGLNECFLDLNDPFELFKIWMKKAEKSEINDPNAMSLATSDKKGNPSVRVVLLKDILKDDFIFYTNLNSKKSLDLKENPKAEMCFYWKSVNRQIRINGTIKQVNNLIADKYFSSRDYESNIGAWASDQSKILKDRNELTKKIEEYKKKYSINNLVPRPTSWSGWSLTPDNFEFWLRAENRIHERLKYKKIKNGWKKILLNP